MASFPQIQTKMLDVGSVAELLGCSMRHVYRLVDRGAMPPPVRLGKLIRWSWQALMSGLERAVPL